MTEPTPEQLDLLLALQDSESRIRRLEHQRDDLPEQQQLDAVKVRLDQIGRERDDVRVELDRASAELRQIERETQVLSERRDAEQVRLYDGTVTNPREMRSVEAEIESTARRIGEHEDQLLEIMEQVEELEGRATALDAEISQLRDQTDELTVARDTAATGILAELGETGVERDRSASGLDPDLLARFEAAAARSGGVGVGVLEDNTCSACRIGLSMADVGELLAGPPLTTCPECRRLLIVPA